MATISRCNNISDSEALVCYLAARIERWMESGEPVLALSYMLPAVQGRLDLLNQALLQWQKEGKIEWLKELDPQKPDEQVVRFKKWIGKDVPWPR